MDSRQHKFLEVIERLFADHDNSKLYAQLNEAPRRITLPHTSTAPACHTSFQCSTMCCSNVVWWL